ncbi:Glycoside hydrolase family 18, catalytic domain [Sesbania bispinosa]|nr:Glycoside hydrolase family 18, catalytic domain [Sesbania bispinosa]
MSHNFQAVWKPKIFREYIGVKPYPDNLNNFPEDIINPKISEFHFILGFATEDYDQEGKGTGYFKRTWNYDYFSPDKVRELKKKYGNVKVIISIGGRHTDSSQYPFNPAEKELWSDQAIESLKEVIADYDGEKDECGCNNVIDGIEINYEEIKCTDTDFAHYIGKVIKELKKLVPSIKVVSIAPSDLVRPHYKRLYQEYHDYINWVDYQFYDQKVSSKDEFVNLFRELSNEYQGKLLAGFSTDPNDAGKISREVFLEGCSELIHRKLLPGISVWDANDSVVPRSNEKPFLLEEKAQNLLTGSD